MNVYMEHSEDSAVGYYRVWQPAYWIEKLGLASVRRLPDNATARPIDKSARDVKLGSMQEDMEWADIASFQRRGNYLQYSLIETVYKKMGIPCVLEMDDDLINIDRHHPQYGVYRQKNVGEVFETVTIPKWQVEEYRKKLPIVKVLAHNPDDGNATIVIVADYDVAWLFREAIKDIPAMTVTTEHLANVYRKFCPNVYVLPNCIDFNIWDNLPPVRDKKEVIIGWAGGYQHIKDFDILEPVLRAILAKYPNVRFHWAGCETFGVEMLQRKHKKRMRLLKRTPIQTWPQRYASWNFDIGLAPLRQSKFNDGKSNLKWLENSARKIPTVATDIVPYQTIKNGETGYLCKDTAEWVSVLSELIEKPELRKRIGLSAYNDVKANYNAEKNVSKYIEAYTDIIKKYKDGKYAKGDGAETESASEKRILVASA